MDKDGNYHQTYIEKVYYKKNKWILPYTKEYPFINYLIKQPQNFTQGERLKIDMEKQFDETHHQRKYNFPYYKKKGKYAISLMGFVL